MSLRITKEGLNDFMIGLSIFVSSITFFKTPFEGYFHYLIFLAYFPFFISNYGWRPLTFKILIIPFVFSGINLFIGNCDSFGFIKIFGGMLVSVLFYDYVFEHYNFDFDKLFNLYCRGAIICCYIGLIEQASYLVGFSPGYSFGWLLNKWGIHQGGFLGLRLNSIFAEPSQFALLLLPALFVAIKSLLLREFDYFSLTECVVVLLCLVLTTSSTGFIGIFVTLLILAINFGQIVNLIIFTGLGIAGYLALYTWVPDFKSRVDHSVNLWTKDNYTVEDINTSSFVLFNNYHVAFSNLADHPLTGTGLGSYPIAYEKYSLTKAHDFIIKKGFDNNAQDGNSLLLRSVAELGILGLVFWLVFIFKFFRRRTEEDDKFWLMSGAMLIIIVGYLVRQGNYFINGFPFFCLFYYYLSTKQTQAREAGESELVPQAAS